MKEEKVYVDELPKSCKTCQFQCYGECRNGCDILKTDYSMTQCHIMRGKYKDCPLIDIKTHDRELVKEVLEKVKNEAYKDGFYDEDGNKIITYHINNYILDQIQKEFEK